MEILKNYISEQIALEEHLGRLIADQIDSIDDKEFGDVKALLEKTSHALEQHFEPLNALLDKLEEIKHDALMANANGAASNGTGVLPRINDVSKRRERISKILRDDYSALNLITISNTLLYTTALAFNSKEVAELALKHLENLAPLVVRIGRLMPEVIARELRATTPDIDPAIAEIALKNTQLAWSRAS